MKKLVFVFAIVVLSFQLNAQGSTLNISTYNQIPFDLVLNGELLSEQASQVSVTDLPAGNHYLELMRPKNSNGNLHSYFPFQNRSLYKGTVSVPANMQIDAIVFSGQLFIQNQTALNPPPPPVHGSNYPVNVPPNVNDPYDNYVYQGNQPYYGPSYGNPNIPGMDTHWDVPAPTCPGAQNSGPQHPSYLMAPQAMSPNSFEQLKHSILAQSFSSGQRAVFQQALTSNLFTSQQVFELVSLFTFNNDQLKVAKQAYTRTVDPQNYFIVNNALEFSSSVNELSSYIASL